MMYRMTLAAALGIATTVIWTSHSYAQSECEALVEHGLRDIEVTSSSQSLMRRNFFRYCGKEIDVSDESVWGNLSVDILDFGGGDTTVSTDQRRESLKEWCTEARTALEQDAEQFFRSERINDSALDAFEQCVALSGRGMRFNFDVAPDMSSADINVRYAGEGSGVPYGGVTAIGFVCDAKAPNGEGILNDILPNEGYRLGPQAISINCVRDEPELKEIGGTVYTVRPGGSISIRTGADRPFVLYFSEQFSPSLPDRRAADLEKRIAALEDAHAKQIQVLSDRLEALSTSQSSATQNNTSALTDLSRRTKAFADALDFKLVLTQQSFNRPESSFAGDHVGCESAPNWVRNGPCSGYTVVDVLMSEEGGRDCGVNKYLHLCFKKEF